MNTWMPIESRSDFSLYNLPFGIFSTADRSKRIGVAIGDKIIDLKVLGDAGLLKEVPSLPHAVLTNDYLNDFIALGKNVTNGLRKYLQSQLSWSRSPLKEMESAFVDQVQATMHLPVDIGDYTDFYSSIEHATNVGKMFRDPENALLPNWRHLPVGYHGRASSIISSGTPIKRPKGQIVPASDKQPIFRATNRLDFELEIACVIGKASALGSPVDVSTAEDHIFGLVLFNDWSARDIQKWEYVPLGPFLGKSFASSISPWVVPLEAFADYRLDGPVQEPEVLDYLKFNGARNIDIDLEVYLQPDRGQEYLISQSNFKYMYWNMAQQIAHHTVNGCNLNIGDMMASGTISGSQPSSYGSMLELSWGGKNPLDLPDGTVRTFLEDGDTVVMKGHAQKDGCRVGFGEVRTEILPAD